MRIIHIVDNLKNENMGLWNSVVSTNTYLISQGIISELWFFGKPLNFDFGLLPVYSLASPTGLKISQLILTHKLSPHSDIIVTHGCWSAPTRIGYQFKRKGFHWVVNPHGMLEPWALRQKRFKKTLYFLFLEKRLIMHSSLIRAVSAVEASNLNRLFPGKDIIVIPNGVKMEAKSSLKRHSMPIQYLFLGRLHRKKGLIELVKGWQDSTLNNNDKYTLTIAGPDQGEYKNIEKLINDSNNINYVGAVYGQEKLNLFHQSSFYVLPSFSEGFPTTVLEAMSARLVCLISKGCNFPDALSKNIAIEVDPTSESVAQKLNLTTQLSEENFQLLSNKSYDLVSKSYSIDAIGDKQIKLYQSIISSSQ